MTKEDEFGCYQDVEIKDVTQRFRYIRPGTFLMGSPKSELGRYTTEIQHQVTLTKGFWLADTAVTQELWRVVTGYNSSDFKGSRRPVESVSWEDCQVLIGQLNRLKPSLGFRLPTEAEWEYACRAGTTTSFFFGEIITSGQANYHCAHNWTVPVKSYPPNPWGLYEMHGNVYEWCQDRHGPYQTAKVTNPKGPAEGRNYILRGGGWTSNPLDCRSASRGCNFPSRTLKHNGLRLVLGSKLELGRKKRTRAELVLQATRRKK